MKTIKGDLVKLAIKGEFDLIIHGCNCFCTMGAGIAKTIKQKFPEAYEADLKTEKGDMASSLSIKSLKVCFSSISICFIITSIHLSPRISRAEVTGQSHLNSCFILTWYKITCKKQLFFKITCFSKAIYHICLRIKSNNLKVKIQQCQKK